jgi:hypothetical protein
MVRSITERTVKLKLFYVIIIKTQVLLPQTQVTLDYPPPDTGNIRFSSPGTGNIMFSSPRHR